MKSTEQISEIEELKRRLQAFEEASPELAEKIKQREEELRLQEEEQKIQRERERILSNIPDVIENLSRVAIGDLTPDDQVKTDRDDPRRFRTIFKCFGSFTSSESIKMKEVLQMAFDEIRRQSEDINELKNVLNQYLTRPEVEIKPNEYVFEDQTIEFKNYKKICSMLLPDEYIIKELYNIEFHNDLLDGNKIHIAYLTNFGNIYSIDETMYRIFNTLREFEFGKDQYSKGWNDILKYIQSLNESPDTKLLNSLVSFTNSTNLGIYKGLDAVLTLEKIIFGTNPICLCNGGPEGSSPQYQLPKKISEGKERYGIEHHGYGTPCIKPLFKWTCNNNQVINEHLIKKIINHDFEVDIPGIKQIYFLYSSSSSPFNNEQREKREIISKILTYNFGKKLMDQVTSFIQENKNCETVPVARPIEVQIGIPISSHHSFEEGSDEARINAAIAAHERHPSRPKPKTSTSRSFIDSNNVLRWRM